MRKLKYLLDGLSWQLQDFYLQYSCSVLQVVKQTNSLWIYLFFPFFALLSRLCTGAALNPTGFVFQRGQRTLHGHQDIKYSNSVEVQTLDNEKLLFFVENLPVNQTPR